MKKKISIVSSSFLLPTNSSWSSITKDYSLYFNDFRNYSEILKNKKNSDYFFFNFFLEDLLENNKKILPNKLISNLGDLITSALEKNSFNLVLSYSTWKKDNFFSSINDNKNDRSILFKISNTFNKIAKKFPNFYYFNIDNEFTKFGMEKCFETRNWYLSRCRLSIFGLDILCKSYFRILEKIAKPSKKVLILDCDNTLWGGVLGEDGISGIKIGSDGEGMIFKDFQHQIKLLLKQGILLCICSKNNEEDVLKVFQNHKEMVLKKKDITNFKVNWNEKYKNIKEIANELSLAVSSFVFWDDDPIEREKAKLNLPSLEVVNCSENIEDWIDQLINYDSIRKIKISKKELKKTQQYKIRSKFIENSRKFKNEKDYLKSINLRTKKIKINSSNIVRASQMCMKTNQFNNNLERLTESDILKINKDKKNEIFLFDLKDIYGDHGIVGLVIYEILEEYIFIKNFLISCRVLGRSLENWVLGQIKELAIKKDIKKILINFEDKKKNNVAELFLANSGFTKINKSKYSNNLKKYKLSSLQSININNIDNSYKNIYS